MDQESITLQLKRLDPIQTANTFALIYFALALIWNVVLAPILVLITIAGSEFRVPGISGPYGHFAMLVVGPILGLLNGWGSGLVGSHVYNFVARRNGGLKVEAHSTRSPLTPVAP